MLATEEDMPDVVSFVEIGLMESRNMQRESLTIGLWLYHLNDGQENIMKEIELLTNRIVNALHGTKNQNWRFLFEFPHENDEINDRKRICRNLAHLHLAHARDD